MRCCGQDFFFFLGVEDARFLGEPFLQTERSPPSGQALGGETFFFLALPPARSKCQTVTTFAFTQVCAFFSQTGPRVPFLTFVF